MRRTLARCLFAVATAGQLFACAADRAPQAPATTTVAMQEGALARPEPTAGLGLDKAQGSAALPSPAAPPPPGLATEKRAKEAAEAPKDAKARGDASAAKLSVAGVGTGAGYGVGGMAAASRSAPARDVGRAEHFQDYGQNAWTTATSDKLSTFAADVDTASFTIARRKLREGVLPPTAAVRVEEFVNYFSYGYDTSAATAARPFTVTIDGAASPLGAGRHLLRVGVASAAKPIGQRPAANLVFLVDVSGSMRSPDKLELAKRSLRVLVDALKDGDTVALVTYAGATRVVLPPTGLEHKETILSALEDLTAGGSTAMASGIQLAYQQALKAHAPGEISRVIILSDGDANVGPTGHDDILATIAAEVKRGVTLSTIGFGQGNYQDTTMEQLANKGNGNAYYIDSLSQAKRVFAEQLGSTLEVIAKDVKLQVEFDATQVARYRLVGYENRDIADDDFRDDKVDAGEIGAGHQVTALYELELTGKPGAAPLATVRVRHKAPTADVATEHAVAFDGAALGARLADAPRGLRLAVAAAAFADILRGGADAATWDLKAVRAIAASVADDADSRGLVAMIDQALALRGGTSTTTTIAQ